MPGVCLDQPCHLQFHKGPLWFTDALPNLRGKGLTDEERIDFPKEESQPQAELHGIIPRNPHTSFTHSREETFSSF